MKRCKRCGEVKSGDDFQKSSQSKDGLQSWCRSCYAKVNKEGILNSPENPRKGFCTHCSKEFILLSKKRKYCSNLCRSLANQTSLARIDWRDKNQARSILYRTRHSAKKKGIPFNLELEDVIIPELCPILGIKLEKSKDNASDNSPSLDKIVPELGYVKGNVRIISQRANLLKSNATLEELKLVYEDAKRINPETTLLEQV